MIWRGEKFLNELNQSQLSKDTSILETNNSKGKITTIEIRENSGGNYYPNHQTTERSTEGLGRECDNLIW